MRFVCGREFPYVLDDPAWAERHGYGRAEREREREEARRDPNGLYVRSLPPHRRPQALAAANGPRPRGLLATLPSGGRIQRSDQGCVAGWARCMREAGHPYATPGQARCARRTGFGALVQRLDDHHGAGQGQEVNDNVSSHKWVDAC
ncbi:hypothetical protein [Streptomyces sp. NPDC053079]|uniref:hypothetical protein n=1 Tax=Streptomyces sp. NPDC053079 TaxID=3365697 RepID=UPI0037CE8B21